MTNSPSTPRLPELPLVPLLALVALGFVVAVFDYFWTGNGIHGSPGALLVVASSALAIIASALIAFDIVRGGWRVLFDVLLGLDFLGTAVAAYFLESWLLLGLVVLGAIAWLVHILRPKSALVEAAP